MRMWNVDPKVLCRKHLLGEHLEMHMFAGALNKGKKLDGFISSGLVEVHKIRERHFDLRVEMLRRGYRHKSPLPLNIKMYIAGKVSKKKNLSELANRCSECRKNIINETR